MVPPTGTGISNRQFTAQSNISFNQQQTDPYHITQQLRTLNNGISPVYNSWSNASAITYAAASTCTSACAPNYMMTNSHRILGMETTIDYLKELLTKEFDTRVKFRTTVKALTHDLENTRRINKHLITELQKVQAEKKQVSSELQDVLVAQHEVSVTNKKELLDAKNELVTAHNSISDLMAINSILESKVSELQKLEEGKRPNTLFSQESETVKTTANECVCFEKYLLDGKQTDNDTLRLQLDLLNDELNSAIRMKDVITCMFKELGKKHLYMVEYSGEQMYTDYDEKHAKFIGQLNSLKGNLKNKMKCAMIEHTLDCLQDQLKLLEDCRKEFRVTIELLICRVDQEFAVVSDLSIRARKPSFEIPIEDFDQLLQVIEQIGGPESDEELNPEN